MNSRSKWRCAACTYENWPAAIKCTLCRSSRPPAVVEDELARLRFSPDDLIGPGENVPHQSCESGAVTRCPSCTFINKPDSFKCEQCFHVLQDPGESGGPPKVGSASILSSSHQLSPDTGKWSCPQCTYANWPKSKHCVMCHSLPTSTTEEFCSHRSEEATRRMLYNSCVPTMNSAGSRPLKLKVSDHQWLDACRAVVENEVSPIERYLLGGGSIEKRLTKKDCCYLNRTVKPSRDVMVMSNTIKVDRFPFTSEDNFTSGSIGVSLSDDTQNPHDQLKLRAGWTLVDLAIRFGRTDLINLFIALNGLQSTNVAVSTSSTSPRISSATVETEFNRPNQIGGRNKHSKQPPPTHHLLSRASALLARPGAGRSKWMPCQASPQISRELRSTLCAGIKYCHGDFPCAFLNEWGTFALPHSITKFPPSVRYLLLAEACDSQAQSELEDDAKAINWWFVPGQKQANRLFALWNRTAGDCLLDSVLQACWGVFDRENFLRRTLAESLRTCERSFYSRWREYEALQAACHYILDDNQCRRDWDNVLTAASRPGGALEQIHIFALSHILRRPIIVYGVKYIKNFLDEPIGIANFQGIYIPLLWDRNQCSKNPIVLGYTRGHFTALVPMEPFPTESQGNPLPPSRMCSSPSSRKHSPTPTEDAPIAIASTTSTESNLMPPTETLSPAGTSIHPPFIYLPLVDRQGATLPIHFTTEKEANSSHVLLREWLDVVSSRRGLPLARLRLQPRHVLVERMLDEWLSSYKALAKLSLSSNTGGQTTDGERSSRPDSSSTTSSSSLSSSSNSISIPSACDTQPEPRVTEPDERSQSS